MNDLIMVTQTARAWNQIAERVETESLRNRIRNHINSEHGAISIALTGPESREAAKVWREILEGVLIDNLTEQN